MLEVFLEWLLGLLLLNVFHHFSKVPLEFFGIVLQLTEFFELMLDLLVNVGLVVVLLVFIHFLKGWSVALGAHSYQNQHHDDSVVLGKLASGILNVCFIHSTRLLFTKP